MEFIQVLLHCLQVLQEQIILVEEQVVELYPLIMVVQVSWLRERLQVQEFSLQHVVHVHQLHQLME